MFDYELFAPDDATMQTALTALNMKAANSGKVGVNVFATDYYGTKFVSSGTGINTVWTPQPGVYCNIRWMGATALNLPANITSQGATIKLLAAPFFRTFASAT